MKAKLEYNLPEDQEQFNVGMKAMDWALLAWSMNQELVRMKMKFKSVLMQMGSRIPRCLMMEKE